MTHDVFQSLASRVFLLRTIGGALRHQRVEAFKVLTCIKFTPLLLALVDIPASTNILFPGQN